MITYDRKTLREFSMLGSHAVFGRVVLELAKTNDKIVALVADQASFAGLDDFKKNFPTRHFNVGIAEQNMVGIAAGLAKEGFVPFVAAQAAFATARCFEQIKVNAGYMKQNIKIVGLSAGFAIGVLGATHMCNEDIALLRSIPNLTILSPADCAETAKALTTVAQTQNPTYIRLTGWLNAPVVYKADYDFEIGKSIVLKEGDDLAIIATGSMVYNALQAAKILAESGINAKVVNFHTIKPLDTLMLDDIFSNYKFVVTVEEHFKAGGLGAAVAEYKAAFKNAPPQLILGIEDKFEKAGEYNFLLEKCGLTAKQIAQRILKTYGALK